MTRTLVFGDQLSRRQESFYHLGSLSWIARPTAL
jgi:hypothetical protein